jgi:hypothetical protein
VASPTVTSVTESSATADDATPYTVSRPAGIAGNKTSIVIGVDGAAALTTPAGYTQHGTDTSASGFKMYHYWRDEDGSESTTVDITSDATEKWAAIVYQLAGVVTGSPADFNSGPVAPGQPNPGNIAVSDGTKDYLGIAGFVQDGSEADDDTWCSAAPTDYTNLIQKTTDTGGVAGDNVSVASAQHAFTGTTDVVTNFTTAQSLAYIWFTLAWMGAAGAPGPPLRVVTNPQRW